MAKKGTAPALATQRKSLRDHSAYLTARSLCGLCLVLPPVLAIIAGAFASLAGKSILPLIVALSAGVPLFAAAGLVGAVFDLADSALDNRMRSQLEAVRRENTSPLPH